MNAIELLGIIGSGETSTVQFKQKLDNEDSIAQEIIAMSNSKGGIILIGVEDKTGKISGLDYEQLRVYGNKLATIANDRVKPQVFVTTEVVSFESSKEEEKKVLIVYVPEGIAKPYKDNHGAIFVKQGADKRRLTDNNEQIRLLQQSGMLYVDEWIVPKTTQEDIDISKVKEYIKQIQKRKSADDFEVSDIQLNNLSIIEDSKLTLGGLLFFSKHPQKYRPLFCIKAVSYFGNSIGGTDYRDKENIEGTIPDMFEQTMKFMKGNLHHVQVEKNFNSQGVLEISKIALEELVLNALVHRDYSKNSPIRVMIFDDRLEIVSPGPLPNSLTIENIKLGQAVARNNLLVSYASKLLPYSGYGSGIIRAIEEQPNIEFYNDVQGEQFRVVIQRPEKK